MDKKEIRGTMKKLIEIGGYSKYIDCIEFCLQKGVGLSAAVDYAIELDEDENIAGMENDINNWTRFAEENKSDKKLSSELRTELKKRDISDMFKHLENLDQDFAEERI